MPNRGDGNHEVDETQRERERYCMLIYQSGLADSITKTTALFLNSYIIGSREEMLDWQWLLKLTYQNNTQKRENKSLITY